MEGGVDRKKLFVGGISQLTDEVKLKMYFEQFGNVVTVEIKKDQDERQEHAAAGKRHRGFGFVTFDSAEVAANVLSLPAHYLDEKKIDPKPAEVKPSQSRPMPTEMAYGSGGAEECDKKIFVGGLANGTTEEQVREYLLSAYPDVQVKEVEFKYDKATHRMRGFGFVTLESAEQAAKVIQKRFHEIQGKPVEVKKAQPRQATVSGQARHAQLPFGYPGYGTDYSHNGQQYQQQQPQYYANGQYYGYDAQTGGYNQYGATGTGYSYDQSAYTHTQSSAGARQPSQTYYQQQPNLYGHGGAQQMGAATGYAQETSSTYGARAGYTTQEAAPYGGQSAYGGGGTSTSTQQVQQPPGHYPTGSSSYGNH